jgi:hypothetical protein
MPLTPEERADLIAAIEIKRRMAVNAVRTAAHDIAVAQRGSARGAAGRVVISPRGMAHLAFDGTGLQPICVHYDDGRTEGWTVAEYTWDAVPLGFPCCRTCIARS